MTIVEAAGLRDVLLARLGGGGPMVIDAGAVEEIDTAVLQLLASLWRSAAARGTVCSWSGVSEAMRRSANLIGMSDMLQLPAALDRHDAAA
jgi:anti-anti-sigma regulatory factor